jgi:hypothetical protein
MKRNNIFYYTEETEEGSFTDQPQHTMDISRLIENKPYWIKTSNSTNLKPKSLVFADVTAPSWIDKHIDNIKKVFSELLEEGFSLYLLSSKGLIPLTAENLILLSQISYQKDIPLIGDEAIYALAFEQHGIIRSQIQILNDHWASVLLFNSPAENRQMSISRLMDCYSDLSQVSSYLLESKPKIKRLLCDRFDSSTRTKNYIDSITSLLPEVEIIQDTYKTLSLDNTTDKLTDKSPVYQLVNKRKINSFGMTFNFEQLKYLEKISIAKWDVTYDNLKTIISTLRNLDSLDLTGPDPYYIDIVKSSNKALKENELEITWDNIKLNVKNLQISYFSPALYKLLAKVNGVEVLTIKYTVESDKNSVKNVISSVNQLNLLNLEKFHAHSVDTEYLSSILKYAKNLKLLNLDNCYDLNCIYDINLPLLETLSLELEGRYETSPEEKILVNKLLFPHLKKLKINTTRSLLLEDPEMLAPLKISTLKLKNCDLSLDILENLIKKSVQLHYLRIENITFPKNSLCLDHHLPLLEKLYLSFQENNEFDYNAILEKATTNLKDLTINNTSFELNQFKFPELQQLALSEFKNTDTNFFNLIQSLSKLESLFLFRCEFQKISSPLTLKLPALKTLDIYETEISIEILKSLLLNSKELESFSLIGSFDLQNCKDSFEEEIVLSKLKKLIWCNAYISTKNFQHLFKNSRNLIEIDIDIIQNTDDKDIEPLFFPLLKKLTLDNSSITTKSLENIIYQSSEIETLSLMHCNSLKENFEKKLILQKLKSLDLSHSCITTENLESLIYHAGELKELNLENCTNLITLFRKRLILQKLESLNLSKSSITTENLESLISDAIELKNLNLENCKNLISLFNKEIILENLENLNLTNSTIKSLHLEKLLSKASSLTELHINHCRNLETEDMNKKLNLLNLKSLYAYESTISIKTLSCLLANTPNLSRLELNHCMNLFGTLDSNVNLSALTDLCLINSSINNETLYSFIKNAPNLKKLYIDGCNSLTFDRELIDVLNDLQSNGVKIYGYSNCTVRTNSEPNNPTHDVSQYLNFKPTPLDIPFVFRGENNTKNQAMIIEKLSQYITILSRCDNEALKKTFPLNEQHIPMIQNGICQALSHLFCMEFSVGNSQWDGFIKTIKDWSGEAKNITETLHHYFSVLSQFILDYHITQEKSAKESIIYCGEQLDSVLKDLIDNSMKHQAKSKATTSFYMFYLNNSWHQIAIFFLLELIVTGENSTIKTFYGIYDPNFINGVKVYSNLDKLIKKINKTLGFIVNITKNLIVTNVNINQTVKRESSKLNTACINSLDASNIKAKINANSFLSGGGLIRLHEYSNQAILLEMLNEHTASKEALRGLLLRDILGRPAWLIAYNTPSTVEYAKKLLQEFVNAHPQTYKRFLQASLNILSSKFRDAGEKIINTLRVELTHDLPESPKAQESIEATESAHKSPKAQESIEATESAHTVKRRYSTSIKMQAEKKKETYSAHFKKETLNHNFIPGFTQVITQDPIIAFCKAIFNKPLKQLIEFDDSDDLQSIRLMLEAHCKNIHYFYADTPSDLICSSAYIKHSNNQGILTSGPGGKLYDYLNFCQKFNIEPIIIVNYDNFDTPDIIRFNCLLEKSIDGTPLPESTRIIGLINTNKPNCYQGADFYSRMDSIYSCPISKKILQARRRPLPLIKKIEQSTSNQILHLFNARDWEERLLGRWVIQGEQLTFVKGELSDALLNTKSSNISIEIHNGLWKNPLFRLFWERAFARGYIESPLGERFEVPEKLSIITHEGYDWESLTQYIRFVKIDENQVITHVLNPNRLTQFFTQYCCEDERLYTLKGVIAQNEQKTLLVHVTRHLSEDDWAMLLMTCQNYQVTLNCTIAASVELPQSLQRKHLKDTQETPSQTELVNISPSSIFAYESNDVDTTVAQIVKETPDSLVIDISECEARDLLMHLTARLDKERMKLVFTERKGALLTALEKRKNVILKGRFSVDLGDALAPLLLMNIDEFQKNGNLKLVSSDLSAFKYLPQKKINVTTEDKKEILLTFFRKDEIENLPIEQLEKEPLSRLKTRLFYYKEHPDESTDNAWKGLERISANIKLTPLDITTSKKESSEFIRRRVASVKKILSYSPYVFLTGLTGVGKTSFVEKYLNQSQETQEPPAKRQKIDSEISFKQTKLYSGENQILDFARDTDDSLKILFIDEANISKREWSEFEGLFNTEPHLLIEGVIYPLTQNHKVVFAGNPLSYGEGRCLPPLFSRHGHALEFEPLPLAYIFEKILKPIMNASGIEKQTQITISKIFLDVYRYLCENAINDVAISPRELEMMAMLTLNYIGNNSFCDSVIIAQYYAYQIAKPLVLEKDLLEFNKKFTPKELFNPDCKIQEIDNAQFWITPSRLPLFNLMRDVLQLREKRCKYDESIRYCGLGGMIIEGFSGIGKSELVTASLQSLGYKETNGKSEDNKLFYRLPASMQYNDKVNLLLKAFNEGAVVVIDEINSAPMMERLLNSLLMGKDLEGNRPNKSGFMIIGTQNPVSMDGRRKASTALSRRLINIQLPEYPLQEIIWILEKKGISEENAILMAKTFQQQVENARFKHLKPIPTFRDLIKLADKELADEKRMDIVTHDSSESDEENFSSEEEAIQEACNFSF